MTSYKIPNNQEYRRSWINRALMNLGYDPYASWIEMADLVVIEIATHRNHSKYGLVVNNNLIQPNLYRFSEHGYLLPISSG